MLVKKLFIITVLMLILCCASNAQAENYLPDTVQNILEEYRLSAQKQGIPAPIKQSESTYVMGKDCVLKFGTPNPEGNPNIILIQGVPTHDFKFFPNTREAIFIVYDIVTKNFTEEDKQELVKKLNIKRDINTLSAYGEYTINNISFDIAISKISGLYFKVTKKE